MIPSWDGKVEEFLNETDDKDKIVNCERMKVRKMDTEKCITNWVPSNLLVVTFDGPRVPEKVSMYGGLT